jgi:hypothetical protein
MMSNSSQLKYSLPLLTVLLTFASLPSARADTVLRWKFKPGETLRYVMHQKMVQKGEVGPAPITVTMNQTAEMSWAVTSVDSDGVASLTQTFTRMRIKMESPQGIMMDYDTASEEEPQGFLTMMAPVFDAMVNKPISMKVDPRGNASDVQIPQAMVDSWKKVPGMEQMGDMFSDEFMEKMSGLGAIPEKAVSPGDTWTDVTEGDLPMIGKMKVETMYEYLGSENRDGKQLEKIRVTQKMDISPGEKPVGIVMKIGEHDSTGITYFDNAAGRFAENQSKSTIKMEGTMGEQPIKMDTEMDIRMNLESVERSEEASPDE